MQGCSLASRIVRRLRESREALYTCDVILTLLLLGLTNYRRESICIPFPPMFPRGQFQEISETIKSIPPLATLRSSDSISSKGWQLLKWILHLDVSFLPPSVSRQNAIISYSFPMKVSRYFPKNLDHLESSYGTLRVFHGSAPENFYSIMLNGVKTFSNTRLQQHGAMYGSGVYFSSDQETSSLFAAKAKISSFWENSEMLRMTNSRMADCNCLLEAKVVDFGKQQNDIMRQEGKYYVLKDVEYSRPIKLHFKFSVRNGQMGGTSRIWWALLFVAILLLSIFLRRASKHPST